MSVAAEGSADVRAFDAESSRALLDLACTAAGLRSAGAQALRLASNALYRLDDTPVVVRIGRSPSAARKEVEVARWLAGAQFPAARLMSIVEEQPLQVAGVVVTFWRFIESACAPVETLDLAVMLRRLHTLPVPADLELPPFQPMPKVEARLRQLPSGAHTADDIAFLRSRHKQLTAEYEGLTFELPRGPIHGDAHTGNLMRASDGEVLLIDFEDFAVGPREWDLSVLATRYDAFGWASKREYDSFVTAYGFDPIAWPGFPTVRAIRELNMTTWLMQRAGESREVDEEIRRRLRDLRDESSPRQWNVY